MFKLPFGRKRAESFGLDVGSSAIKVVQLRETGDGYALSALAIVPLPAETIVDGVKTTVEADNIGFQFYTYEEQKTLDRILRFSVEAKTVVTEPYAAIYKSAGI